MRRAGEEEGKRIKKQKVRRLLQLNIDERILTIGEEKRRR